MGFIVWFGQNRFSVVPILISFVFPSFDGLVLFLFLF